MFPAGEGFLPARVLESRGARRCHAQIANRRGLAASSNSSMARRRGHVPDFSQAGGIEADAGLRADARQPFVGQRLQKGRFASRRDFLESGRLLQLRGDRTHQLIGPNPFADDDFQPLVIAFE